MPAFAAQIFAAETLRVIHRADATIQHAACRLDDTVVVLAQMSAGPNTDVHVYLDDPDGAFARASDAGAPPVQEVAIQPDGERRGAVRDADGTTWWPGRATD